jgi:hypothetical protein
MIYIADGPSDIPAFSIVKHFGGKTYAVYKPYDVGEFDQAKDLLDKGRVNSFGEANYTRQSQTYMWIKTEVGNIASRIVRDKEAVLRAKVGSPPKHLA